MDPLDFGSLARIRILLLPVGPIKRTTFAHWASEIRTFENIRLGDIPADAREERARFMPGPLASGHVHLSFPTHPLPPTHTQLSLFRPSDFPLGVIGIASCSPSSSSSSSHTSSPPSSSSHPSSSTNHAQTLSTIQSQFQETVSRTFPEGSAYPLAQNCFVFEEGEEDVGDVGGSAHTPGVVVIPGMMGNKKIYVGTLLADLCSSILAEFANVVQALESPLGNEYLNAALFPLLPPASSMPLPLSSSSHTSTSDSLNIPMRSSLPPLPHPSSQPDLNTSSSLLRSKTPTPLTMKRNSSIGPGPPTSPYRQASLPLQSSVNGGLGMGGMGGKKKVTAIGAVSSHGRLFKVLGDFFLLAGRTMDASVWFTEAIAMLKASQDNVWHASALEGLAVIPILDAWSAEKSDPADTSPPWSDIASKLTQATDLYHRSTPPAPSDSESAYSFVSWFYTRAVLRHTMLLYAVWSTKGWGLLAFNTLLNTGLSTSPPTLTPSSPSSSSSQNHDKEKSKSNRISYSTYERLTTSSGIPRSSIADILSQLHGPWLLHLGAHERISILSRTASLYGILGYRRKEAYVLREVLGCVMDLVVCGREESGGRVGVVGGGGGGGGGQGGSVGVRANDSKEGNESVLRLVRYVCRVHGVDLEAVKFRSSERPASSLDVEAESEAGQEGEGEQGQEPYGWPELQIGIVREAIAVAEALPDYPSVAQFSLSALKTLHLVMSQGDQHHLYSTASKALSTAKRRGDARVIEYWSGRPVVSVEILPLPFVRLPLEKPVSLLEREASEDAVPPILVGMTDPFLYNPRRLTAGQGAMLLVQNETFEVVITLRNPFVFDLELSSLSLSTTGVAVETKPLALIVPANSYHPVTITAHPLSAGQLTIRGCIVQAPGGASREFLLPLATPDEDTRQERRRSAMVCESGRSKYFGLEARPWERKDKRVSVGAGASQKEVRFLVCKVVPEQPLLRIRRTSLTHGAVMLYNGEKSSIRITLENVSDLPVDFLHLTFDDSSVAPAQQALTEGELSVFETYETEYELIHRPLFTWDKKGSRQSVGTGEKVVLTVGCFGKVDCTSGTIHISYAYCNRPHEKLETPPEVFHTRQLSYPVLVTVYHMLECHGLEILPYTPDMLNYSADNHDGKNGGVGSSLQVQSPDDWCIFSVEVRNTYGIPFEVTFEADRHGKLNVSLPQDHLTHEFVDTTDASVTSTTSLVPPGSTTRILLPLQRFRLSDEQISQPIPTLSDRQFVVAKSNLSSKEEAVQRELFWYREELLKRVRGRWKETGGSRHGDLSLRKQRLTLPMLDVLQVENIRIQLSLHTYDSDSKLAIVSNTAGSFFPPSNEFVYLHARIANQSPKRFTLVLDVSVTPPEHVLYEGVLSGISIGHIDAGDSYEIEIPLTFVACGRFDVTARTYIPGQNSSAGHGQIGVFVK
ncbi:transport protein Trs120 or TRAPPC9 TRAPP II complex subunit-domain-containing protein [Irpex lacteus]|nr:transport protein Trs120 or TRAPPC9 TRAPP II complex subunit-domain-containing protein [Irpex lacteus]